MKSQGKTIPSGSLKMKKSRNYKVRFKNFLKILSYRLRIMRKCITNFGGDINYFSTLRGRLIRADGGVVDLGILGTKAVTDVGVAFIVDAFQNTTEVENMKFHDSGTGTTAENASDTALETKVETGRTSGTTTEGASANIYRTVGTISYTATRAITEHGIFSASSGGTLLDRTVFSAVNVGNGDSIEFTYELTFPSGG